MLYFQPKLGKVELFLRLSLSCALGTTLGKFGLSLAWVGGIYQTRPDIRRRKNDNNSPLPPPLGEAYRNAYDYNEAN